MKFNLKEKTQATIFYKMVNNFMSLEKCVELKEVKKTRTSLQNSSLHLYFTLISEQLNESGQTFNYKGVRGNIFEVKYTSEIVKNFIWRPIQISLFKIKSTTKINTTQINEIVDILSKHFGERFGFYVAFPNIADKLHKDML